MAEDVTYSRPVKASIMVRLETGDEFAAAPADWWIATKFSPAGGSSSKTRPGAICLLTAGPELAPLWSVLFAALNHPTALTDGSMESAETELKDLVGALRAHRAAQVEF